MFSDEPPLEHCLPAVTSFPGSPTVARRDTYAEDAAKVVSHKKGATKGWSLRIRNLRAASKVTAGRASTGGCSPYRFATPPQTKAKKSIYKWRLRPKHLTGRDFNFSRFVYLQSLKPISQRSRGTPRYVPTHPAAYTSGPIGGSMHVHGRPMSVTGYLFYNVLAFRMNSFLPL